MVWMTIYVSEMSEREKWKKYNAQNKPQHVNRLNHLMLVTDHHEEHKHGYLSFLKAPEVLIITKHISHSTHTDDSLH